MKKIFIVALFLLLYFVPTYSQWGAQGGVNFSSLTNSSETEILTSFHIGGSYDFKLSNKWYFQPELQFSGIGFNLHDDKFFLKGGHVKIYALELPVNFSFRPTIINDMNLLIDLGLYARCGLFGNKTYEYYESKKVDGSPFDAYNRFDAGLNLGIGLQKKQYYGLISYQRGFFHAEKDIDAYHQVFKFSIGCKF
jgi:hypothetical protein